MGSSGFYKKDGERLMKVIGGIGERLGLGLDRWGKGNVRSRRGSGRARREVSRRRPWLSKWVIGRR